ncbi:carbon-nitrogen hydrolase [Peniophora sp. CONT]|nr:carbon-nitrogen hydrolase [Peniophora sp. CONT]
MLRLAVVQLAPVHGDVQGNIARAGRLLEDAGVGKDGQGVDAVFFPEMAFTGYVFDNPEDVVPLLEDVSGLAVDAEVPTPPNPADTKPGPTIAYLSSLARGLNAHVFAGAPVALHPAESGVNSLTPGDAVYAHNIGSPDEDIYGRGREKRELGANAALVLRAGDGALVACARKANLFRSDAGWAKAGTSFTTLDLPKLGRTCVAICMDLNPFPATNDELEVFELAEHCIATRARVLVLLNAWLRSSSDGDGEGEEEGEDWGTIRYWAHRLRPLYTGEPAAEGEPSEVLVIVCNRTGSEGGLTFAGSSAVLRCVRGSGRAQLLDAMDGREGAAVWDVRVPA